MLAFNRNLPTSLKCFYKRLWGCSSVGRAPALQAGGRQFESDQLHHSFDEVEKTRETPASATITVSSVRV